MPDGSGTHAGKRRRLLQRKLLENLLSGECDSNRKP